MLQQKEKKKKMGANVSTQIATATTAISNTQNNNCQNDSEIDQSIGTINVNLVGSHCGDIEVTNTAVVSQKCDLSGTASALAQAAQGLTADQKSTLSLSANVSTGIQENTTKIATILNNNCGNASLIKQKIQGANITVQGTWSPDGKTYVPASCDILKFANSASAQQQCVLKTVSDAVSKLDQTQATKQVTEFPPIFSGLLMFLLLPAIGIGVIIFIIVIAKMLKKKDAGGPIIDPKTGKPVIPASASAASSIQGATEAVSAGKGLVEAGKGLFGSAKGLFGKKKGGGGGEGVRTENIPIVALGILMLVWYAKMTEPRS